MQCSAQILNETDWILDSTSDFARADKNLWLLDLSLGAVDQDFALQQLETDGSWGVCYDEWFKKLDPMISALNRFSEANIPPKYAYLAFLKQISKPELLMGYLDSILISDIAATGINFRDELNASTSLVAEVLYKERIRITSSATSPGGLSHPHTSKPSIRLSRDGRIRKPDTGAPGIDRTASSSSLAI
jgi:hypothetical protein